MSIDNCGDDFPRLCTLQQIAQTEGKGNVFPRLPAVLRNPLARSYFTTIEGDLAALDEDAWRRFLEPLPSVQSDESQEQLMSQLHEAKGYLFLKKEGFTKINFIPRSTAPTPDLSATLDGTIVALLEVKTVWQSDYQNDWIEENTSNMKHGMLPTVRRLAPSFPDGLKNKLKSDLQKADSQLLAYPAPIECRRVVYFVIFLDFEQQNTLGITTQIKDYLSILPSESKSIEIECDFQNAFT